MTFRVMEKDPFHANCLPVHIGTLVELNKANGKAVLKLRALVTEVFCSWGFLSRVLGRCRCR